MKQRYWFTQKGYEWYPHHIENINTIKENPDYFVLELTLKEKLKKKFGFHNHYKFECWVRDREGKSWKCFINFINDSVKFLGVVK